MYRITLCGYEYRNEMLQFLVAVDKLFPRPISDRTGLSDFVDKLLEKGKVCCAISDNRIIGAAFFYCNDNEGRNAFLSVLAVLHESQSNGIGGAILSETERVCRENGMKSLRLKANIFNTRAIAFYEKSGYSITEQVIDGDEQKYILTKGL